MGDTKINKLAMYSKVNGALCPDDNGTRLAYLLDSEGRSFVVNSILAEPDLYSDTVIEVATAISNSEYTLTVDQAIDIIIDSATNTAI